MALPSCIPLNPKWGQSWYPHEVSTFGPQAVTHSHLPLPTTIYQYDLNAGVPSWQDFANAAVQWVQTGKDTYVYSSRNANYHITVGPKLKAYLSKKRKDSHNAMNAGLHTNTQGIYNRLSNQFDETQDVQFRDAWLTWMNRVGFIVTRVSPQQLSAPRTATAPTPAPSNKHSVILGILVLISIVSLIFYTQCRLGQHN